MSDADLSAKQFVELATDDEKWAEKLAEIQARLDTAQDAEARAVERLEQAQVAEAAAKERIEQAQAAEARLGERLAELGPIEKKAAMVEKFKAGVREDMKNFP